MSDDRKQEARSQCPCGEELAFSVLKPKSRYEKTITKVGCPVCDSQFMIHVEIEKTPPVRVDSTKPLTRAQLQALDRPFERKYISTWDIIRVTPKASKRAGSLLNRAKEMIIEKVAKKEDGPEF